MNFLLIFFERFEVVQYVIGWLAHLSVQFLYIFAFLKHRLNEKNKNIEKVLFFNIFLMTMLSGMPLALAGGQHEIKKLLEIVVITTTIVIGFYLYKYLNE